MSDPIYLDTNATTAIDPRVAKAMEPYLYEHFGNPSSSHIYGQRTRAAVDKARERVATMLGCTSGEVLFTSGGTESNNTVLKGVAELYWEDKGHIITTCFEHPAILEPCLWLERHGFRVTRLGVDATGKIRMQELEEALTEDTRLVSIMHGNNEVGTLQNLSVIAKKVHEVGGWLHTDASQSIGKTRVKVDELGVDFLTVAGHKLYAPKGVGALFIREGLSLPSFLHGAGHESGRRAGTENVLLVAGLGKASELVEVEQSEELIRIKRLRDNFWHSLHSSLGEAVCRFGHPEQVLVNTLNVGFRHVNASQMLEGLADTVVASAGAACHSETGEGMISTVLQAMGASPDYARGAVRFSLGRWTTEDEIRQVVSACLQTYRQLGFATGA